MTDLRGSRARRIASFASLLFAAAATLATSASPPPPPAITDEAHGSLVVTPDAPIASVDVTVTASATLQAAANSDTSVRIQAGVPPPGVAIDPASAGTVVTVEALEDVDPALGNKVTIASMPAFQTRFDGTCGPGDCVRHYRITAVLADASVDESKIDWVAAAESRFGKGGATGSAPADAHLDVTAGEVATTPKDRTARAEAHSDPIRVDANHPKTTITMDVLRPPDAAVHAFEPLLVLDLPGNPVLNPSQVDVSVELQVDQTRVVSGWVSSRRQAFAGRLPRGCADPAGCRARLQLTISGRPNAPDADVAWLLHGIVVADGGREPGPFTISPPESSTISFDKPDLTARDAGAVTLAAGKSVRLKATATLDETAVPQGGSDVSGTLQAVLIVTSPAVAGAGGDAIGLALDGSYPSGATGREVRVIGVLHPLECDGRSTCRVTFDVGFGVKPSVVKPVEVSWRLEVRFVATDGTAVPPDARLLVSTAPAPN